MTAVNIPLLRKAVEWVEAEAARTEGGHWYQGVWVSEVTPARQEAIAILCGTAVACGTAYCVAGYVGQLVDERYRDDEFGGLAGVHVSAVAREALGLSPTQALVLFDAGNTAEAIREIAEDIAGEPL